MMTFEQHLEATIEPSRESYRMTLISDCMKMRRLLKVDTSLELDRLADMSSISQLEREYQTLSDAIRAAMTV